MARFDSDKISIWRGIIGRQQGSNVSAMRFWREESIPYWKFNCWKKRLAKIDGVANKVDTEPDNPLWNLFLYLTAKGNIFINQ